MAETSVDHGRGRRAVVLVSGVDSLSLAAELGDQGWTVLPLYLKCGFRWETAELSTLRPALSRLRKGRRIAALKVLEAPMQPLLRRHWSFTGKGVPGKKSAARRVYLPGRNVLLLAEAWTFAALSNAHAVAIGTMKGNPFLDATPRFRRAMAHALNVGFGTKILLLAPFATVSKSVVLARQDSRIVVGAFSCLAPVAGRPCGTCNKCEELSAAAKGLALAV